jgi:hypothetical protein
MDDDDVWGGEMPNLPFWRRHSDQSDAEQLDQLLDASLLDTAANPEWQSVSDVLRSAAAAAEPSELAGEMATMAAFRRERVGIRHRRPQPIARYKTVIANRFSTLLPGRIAVGLAAGVVTLTGAATAAYACVLPNPIQSFAHTTIGAPRPSDPKLTVAAIDAEKWKHNPTPSVSVSATPTPSVSALSVSASVTASVSATATATASPSPKVTKKPVLDPTQLAAVQALIDYRLCQSYTAFTKLGKTLDPKALAVLVKAAGSSTPTAIAAYCAALPVPPNPCLVQPLPTVSATPSATPNAKDDKLLKDDGWWRWCGICPKVTASTSLTPTVSATATASPGVGSVHRFPLPWFWCGDRDHKSGHSGDPSATAKPTPTKTPFPGNWWGGGWGFGKGGTNQGGNNQGGNTQNNGQGGTRNGTPTKSIQGSDQSGKDSGKDSGQRH